MRNCSSAQILMGATGGLAPVRRPSSHSGYGDGHHLPLCFLDFFKNEKVRDITPEEVE